MASHLIDTVACPVKVLHRWTGGSKPPVKHPVKDWCKDKKPRWFVAQFFFLPSQTALKYFHKKDDWTTGSKLGTHINLTEVVSTRTLAPKDDEYRLEINLEDYSLLLIFDHSQSPETVCKLLKVALRTFHVKVERCPEQCTVLGECVASLEPDRIRFHCLKSKDNEFYWLFSQVKGFQYKSDFGHLIVDTASAANPAGGQYAFSGTRILQFARKLKDYMSVEEERYRPLPSHQSPQFHIRGGSLRRPGNRYTDASRGLYDLPMQPTYPSAGYTAMVNSNGQSLSADSGMILDPRMFGRARTNTLPHMPHTQFIDPSGLHCQNPYYGVHPTHAHYSPPCIRRTAADDEENIYETINDYSYPLLGERFLSQRPPMPLPLERHSEGEPSPDSPTTACEEEGAVQRQVEEALRKIELGESTVAEDGGYVPVNHLQQMKKLDSSLTEDGYLKMHPHREWLTSQ